MASGDAPLSLEDILTTAEDVVRRFGPAKATVVDVARALGVTHAAVYRHVGSKSELRNLVVERWVGATMPPLRAIAEDRTSPTHRLRAFFDALIAGKRRRASRDPELFAAYRTLTADAQPAVEAHVAELVELTATIVRAGVKDGSFRKVDPTATARAILAATVRFHHPMHAAEWSEPGVDDAFDDVWRLVIGGLVAAKQK